MKLLMVSDFPLKISLTKQVNIFTTSATILGAGAMQLLLDDKAIWK